VPPRDILILTLSDIDSDPRVSRQIKALSAVHRVSVAGRFRDKRDDLVLIPIEPRTRSLADRLRGAWLLKTRQFSKYYWSLNDIRDACRKLETLTFDLVIANDVETLPLALRVGSGAKVLLDAHEYAPREFEDRWVWSFFAKRYVSSFLCGEHLVRTHAVMTVCGGIAREYSSNFGVPEPVVVMNAPYRHDLSPRPCGGSIRMIHHGRAIPSRNIEAMIDMMEYLDDRFTLDFMLVGQDPGYLSRLQKRASRHPRIRFRPPVPLEDIVPVVNGYDIGLFLLPPSTFNYLHALPNKFFEYVQARVAVAVGPSPEMASLAREHGFGVVSEDFSPRTMAKTIASLTQDEVDRLKLNAHRAADKLCFETSEKVLIKKVEELLSARRAS